MEDLKENRQKIKEYAEQIMKLARDTITVRFRFFDTALAQLIPEQRDIPGGFATDGEKLYYNPVILLKSYMDEPNIAVRVYLHVLLHCIFFHQYQYDRLNTHYWDMACDIAVENIILEMNLQAAVVTRDGEAQDRIAKLKKWVPDLTAEKLYREFVVNNPSEDAEREYHRLFTIDSHESWHIRTEKEQETVINEDAWKKISERIKTELKTFSKDKSGSVSLDANIEEATRKRYNYRELLNRFTEIGEEIRISDDEYDYIYYTYGLSVYGNVPLIEPLEYRESKKVKEFVIAIDTSASCRGNIVKAFLRQTYDILKSSESFFQHVNVHIIQCDSQIQSDIKIEDLKDFEEFISHGRLNGFGATDFRPVFGYINELKSKGEFENLKGLIYFTDGYGVYPEKMPDYDVIFAFLNEDDNRQPVPAWAIKVIIEEGELEDEYQSGKGVY